MSRKARESVLLHACCAPCSAQVMRVLSEQHRVTALFYNPNIQPADEYDRRLAAMEALCARSGDQLVVVAADDEGLWEERIRGLAREPEGGLRCKACFALRLEKTAEHAARRGVACFATSLSISPHKDAARINAIGAEIAARHGVRFIARDFKEQDGYAKSCALSRELGLYRQKYCGCRFSMPQVKDAYDDSSRKSI